MSRTIIRSAPDMADGTALDGLEIRLRVEADLTVKQHLTDTPAKMVVADPDDLKLKEKVYAQARIQSHDENDTAAPIQETVHEYEQLNLVNFPQFTQTQMNSLFAGIKKIADQHRENLGLTPSA